MNRKALFDAIREIKGSPLNQAEVDRINGLLDEAPPQPTRLAHPAAFFAALKPHPFDTLTQARVDGINIKLAIFGANCWPLSWCAYGLATSYWETAKRMQPIAEFGKGKGRKYGVADSTGQIPYGRGDVQLTWQANYAKADEELGLNGALVRDYDKALEPGISARIMERGMREGWFTGKKLADYLPESGEALQAQFREARRIINGTDKAGEIAAIADEFQQALREGHWR